MKALSETEIKDRLKEFSGWEYIDNSLYTVFEFENFKEAISAIVRIAFEAEKMDHHPEWANSYKTLEIFIHTHQADGVTEKDFQLAGIIDDLIG